MAPLEVARITVSWVGVLLCIKLLPSRVVSRCMVVFVAPFVVLLRILVFAFPIRTKDCAPVCLAAVTVLVVNALVANARTACV
jgi:hypothetical protein